MKKKGLRISNEFLAFASGFVLGFLIAFAFSWQTVVYLISVIIDK